MNIDELFHSLKCKARGRACFSPLGWSRPSFRISRTRFPNFPRRKGRRQIVGPARPAQAYRSVDQTETLSFAWRRAREIVQQLAHHYAPVYDNQDTVPPWLSDLLCRAVTGEGFTKRELYSDDDDVVYAYRRVVMLNGINVIPQRSDLLDRSMLIGLDRVSHPVAASKSTSVMDSVRGGDGRVCSALSSTRSRVQWRSTTKLSSRSLQRMADFTRWGAAAAEAMGFGQDALIAAYAANLGLQTREAVEGDLVGSALLALMEKRQAWSGTPTELLAALEDASVGESALPPQHQRQGQRPRLARRCTNPPAAPQGISRATSPTSVWSSRRNTAIGGR